MNISSLYRNFDDLHTLLSEINLKFDIIGITETRLKKKLNQKYKHKTLKGIQWNKLQLKQTVAALFYILIILLTTLSEMTLGSIKKKEIESIFMEIINPKGKNVIVGCIYRHPSLNPTEFVDIHIQELLQKMSKEDKTIVLLGDFNIDLLKYDTNKDSTAFLDLMYTNFLLPYVTTPT